MKKIFTLMAATFLTVATFAADHRPSVTLTSSRNYQIVIDGRTYASNSSVMDLSNLRSGQHSIKVYEMNRMGSPFGGFAGLLFKRPARLLDASYFQVTDCDLSINVDFRGQVSVRENRFDDRNGGWNDHKSYGSDPRDNSYNGGWKDQKNYGSAPRDNGYNRDQNDRSHDDRGGRNRNF